MPAPASSSPCVAAAAMSAPGHTCLLLGARPHVRPGRHGLRRPCAPVTLCAASGPLPGSRGPPGSRHAARAAAAAVSKLAVGADEEGADARRQQQQQRLKRRQRQPQGPPKLWAPSEAMGGDAGALHGALRRLPGVGEIAALVAEAPEGLLASEPSLLAAAFQALGVAVAKAGKGKGRRAALATAATARPALMEALASSGGLLHSHEAARVLFNLAKLGWQVGPLSSSAQMVFPTTCSFFLSGAPPLRM